MFEGVLNMPLLKNKAGVRCAKRILHAATWNVNLCDMCFVILLDSRFMVSYGFTFYTQFPNAVVQFRMSGNNVIFIFFSLVLMSESNCKAFINSCWICMETSLFEDYFNANFSKLTSAWKRSASSCVHCV